MANIIDIDRHPDKADLDAMALLGNRIVIALELMKDKRRTIRNALDAANINPDAFVRYLAAYESRSTEPEAKTIEIQTTKGTLVAYPADYDPDNPGIRVDLRSPTDGAMLNLTCTECNQDPDEGPAKIITHVWGDMDQEDATHDIEHENLT